jgi:hypothetical protein
MATPNAKSKKKPGKKILGQPAWVVVAGVAAAIVLGLYLRSRLAAQNTATSPTSSGLPPGDPSGGASSQGAGAVPDLTPFEDLASSLSGLTAILGSGGTAVGTSPDLTTAPAPAAVSPTFSSGAAVTASAPSAPTAISLPSAVGGSGTVSRIDSSKPLTWSNLAPPVVGAVPEGELGAIKAAAGYTGGAPAVLAPNLEPPQIPTPPHAAATLVTPPNPTIAANKTGGSANKKQGVYSVH